MTMSTAALRIDDLAKAYGGKRAVDGVSMTVAREEIVGFLGPNGAGKTSVMNMVMGLVKPDAGSIELLGRKAGADDRDTRLRVGYLQEKPRIYPEMTASAYLLLFARLYGVQRADHRVAEVLERVGLRSAANRPLAGFSRGMQQRACLARVMLGEPDFLILDEPTLGLDPAGVADMRDIFLEMRGNGATLLFSSHQLAEMERVCDSVVFLSAGKVIASGRPADLIPACASEQAMTIELAEEVASLLPSISAIPGVEAVRALDGHRLELVQSPAFAARDSRRRRADVARSLSAAGYTVLSVATAMPTLEDLFLSLSGYKRLRTSTQGQDNGSRIQG